MDPSQRVLLGRVAGSFGVRGELKLESWTQPRAAILKYQPWTLRDPRGGEREIDEVRGRDTGKHLLVVFPDVTDRDASEALRGTEVWVPRSALPPARPGEYYWIDLEGLRVVTIDGVELGHIDHLFSTGASDVMSVRDGARERMIPFVQPEYVQSIDLDTRTVTVDWDPEF